MITTDIAINGLKVGSMYITTKGPNAENPKAQNYYFEYWRVGSSHVASGTMAEENPAIEHLVMRVLHLTRPMGKNNNEN